MMGYKFLTFGMAVLLTCCSTQQKKPVLKTVYAAHRAWGMLGAKIFSTASGQKISILTEGGAAEKAGLRIGDTITSINGKNPGSTKNFIRMVRSTLPGTKITIRGFREWETPISLQATLTAYPQDKQLLLMSRLAIRGLDFERARQLLIKLIGKYKNSDLRKTAQTLLEQIKTATAF